MSNKFNVGDKVIVTSNNGAPEVTTVRKYYKNGNFVLEGGINDQFRPSGFPAGAYYYNQPIVKPYSEELFNELNKPYAINKTRSKIITELKAIREIKDLEKILSFVKKVSK